MNRLKIIGVKKSIFSIITAIFLITKGFSQFNENPVLNLENFDKQRVHWGYFLGFNQYDFKFNYNENTGDVQVDKTVGFNVGLIGNLRINEYFDVRLEPGLYYTERSLNFPGFIDESDYLRRVKSTYIHLPLLIKASAKRFGNFKPYVVGGVSTSLNLSSNDKNPNDNSGGIFRMKDTVYYYEIGFGIDFYFYYFKFSPSIRGIFAITDELVPDDDINSPWTANINKLFSRGVFVNFTFE
jgi:hypothetical protein